MATILTVDWDSGEVADDANAAGRADGGPGQENGGHTRGSGATMVVDEMLEEEEVAKVSGGDSECPAQIDDGQPDGLNKGYRSYVSWIIVY